MMCAPMSEFPFQHRAWMSLRSASSAAAATSIAIMIVLMVAARPAPVRASAPTRLLWISDNGIYRHVACEQVATGTHVTLFSCGEPRLASRDAETIVHAFDHHIFPTDAKEFGVPRGLNTVNAVLVPFTGMTFGYFDENDLAPDLSSAAVHSNHGNFLYVRSLASMPDANKMMDVQEALAHELQHLIDYRLRVLDRGLAPQEVWLNEGLSFYAQISNGYWTPRDSLRVDASAADPAWSLTAMTESSQFLRQHGRVAYGRAGMFVTYLAAQYGPRFTRDLVRNRQTGMEGVDAVLRREHHGSVADAFTRWGVAQLLNVPGKYGYKGLLGVHSRTPRLMYPTVTSYPFDTGSAGHPAMTLQPWTQRYVRFATTGEFAVTIRVTTPPTCRLAAVYGTSAAPGDVTVRMLKVGATHTASLRVGGDGQRYDTVTLVVSAVGSLGAVPVDARPATVRIQASSINARHYQRVPRTASAAGQDADVTL
jgi:hypothetical protein